MGGKSKKPVVGYKYYLGMHMVFSHGPVDHVSKIYVDKREAWTGVETGGPIEISAPELFGGDGREGGVSGSVSVEMGYPSQDKNGYLQQQLGLTDIPAFRGVFGLVLQGCYMGNNPYLKPWSIRAQRIRVRSGGRPQWYANKAPIQSLDSDPSCAPLYAGLSFYLALDLSGSMDDTPIGGDKSRLESAQEAMTSVLLTINSKYVSAGTSLDIMIVGWGGTTINVLERESILRRGVTESDIEDLINWVNTRTTAYFTWFPAAVEDALSFFEDGDDSHSRVSVFVTDGVPTTPGVGPGAPASVAATTAGNTLLSIEGIIAYGIDIGNLPGSETEKMTNQEGTITVTDGNADELADAIASKLLFGCCEDMNPAHIVRECLTDPVWGMGYLDADIDDDAFMYAADYLYAESIGISITWSQEAAIEDFIAEILRHIDGVLYVDRVTGKFVLKLIRDDYAETALLRLDENNVAEVSDAQRPTIGDLISEISLEFWDKETGEKASVILHNQALQQLQSGGGSSASLSYPGFTSYSTANRIAARDLKALSTPLLSCAIDASREAESLNVGDAFILDWPDLAINNVIMRVQQLSFGDGVNNTVRIDAVEDAFVTEPLGTTIVEPGDIWIDPLEQLPDVADPRLMIEAPYWEIVQQQGELNTNNILADDPAAGFVAAIAGRQNNEINARLLVDSGTGYEDSGVLDFSPYAYLIEDVDYTDNHIYLGAGKDLDQVESGTVAQIADELVRVDSIGTDSNGQYMRVGRGILDTTPRQYTFDSTTLNTVIFWGDFAASDFVQYATSESINVKLRTVRGANILSEASAPVNSVTMANRAIRPYPPGNLTFNGLSYPSSGSNTAEYAGVDVIAWAHRDRLMQTDGNLFDYTASSIGPEAGTTYRVEAEAFNISGTSLGTYLSTNVGNVTSYQFDSNGDPIPPSTRRIAIKVYAVRSGYDSWQPAEIIVNYTPDSNEDEDVKVFIEEIENTSAGEFDFSSITAGYKRLVIEGYLRGDVTATDDSVEIFFNTDTTASNYHRQTSHGEDGANSSTEAANARIAICPAASSPANAYGHVRIVIEDYAGSRRKAAIGTYVSPNDSAAVVAGVSGVIWDSTTTAINRVRIRANGHATDQLLGKLTLYGEV